MADRRSTGAESLAVFDQTLDRLLLGTGYDAAVQDQVIDAMRGGAATVADVVTVTGLPLPTVQQAVTTLATYGRIKIEPPAAPRRRKATPGAQPDHPVSNTG